jgi:PPK2 family polyphosphate:nucleotide phosphotransferase
MSLKDMNTKDFLVQPNKKVKISDFPTKIDLGFEKEDLKQQLKERIKKIDELQNILYAENKQALLIIFQGIDAAGKDSAIRAIMTGVNPQGVEVTSFKHPNTTELEHDYLWRHYIKLPERGKIGIFNRSHYENVLICKVHREYVLAENLPNIHSIEDVNDDFFKKRYEQINDFERTIHQNGTKIIKFLMSISKDEQKERFIQRIQEKEKNWKFSSSDLKERKFWNEYQLAFSDAISKNFN